MERIGGLIWSLPNDLKFFKEKTTGKKIFMGKNTYNSLPKRLPNREHFVLTDSVIENSEGINLVYDLEKFIQEHEKSKEEIFVIGGGMVYKQMLPYCTKMYLTEIDAECPDATVYFPEFDKTKYKKNTLYKNSDNGINYTHVEYVKN